MGPRKRSESLGSSGCFRLCNKIMTRSTGNFESQSCNVPQSPGSAANPASCSVSRSPQHHRIALPASTRQKGSAVFGTFLRNQACVWCVFRAVVDGICQCCATRIRSIRGSTDCDSKLLGLRVLFSGRQIALDAGRTGLSSTQCEVLYENGSLHDGDDARLRKLLSRADQVL